MIRSNGTQTKPLIKVLVVALALSALGVAHGQPNPQKDVERVVRDSLVAFGNRDYALFAPYFSEDATVFFSPVQGRSVGPSAGPSANRANVQDDLRRLRSSIGSPTGAPCPAGPADSGGGWTRRRHILLGSETARQRRTLVLRRVGAEWEIVRLHGPASGNQP